MRNSAGRSRKPAEVDSDGVGVNCFLILIFSLTLGWLPSTGGGDLQHLILPALALGLDFAAVNTRLVRTAKRVVERQAHLFGLGLRPGRDSIRRGIEKPLRRAQRRRVERTALLPQRHARVAHVRAVLDRTGACQHSRVYAFGAMRVGNEAWQAGKLSAAQEVEVDMWRGRIAKVVSRKHKRALEELAKHHEHSDKNFSLALAFTDQALAQCPSASLTQRKARLERRLRQPRPHTLL